MFLLVVLVVFPALARWRIEESSRSSLLLVLLGFGVSLVLCLTSSVELSLLIVGYKKLKKSNILPMAGSIS